MLLQSALTLSYHIIQDQDSKGKTKTEAVDNFTFRISLSLSLNAMYTHRPQGVNCRI